MAAKSRLCGLWIPSAWPLDPVCVAAESCLRASRTGAFTSLYQDAPHDLLSGIGDFYERRRLTLDEILGRIRLGMGREILAASHAAHHGQSCIGLDWSRFELALLQAVVVSSR